MALLFGALFMSQAALARPLVVLAYGDSLTAGYQLPPGQGFSIYSLAAVLPLLAAKQRVTDANDWMSTDAEVACPDPNCPSRLRITRLGKRTFSHAETTAVALNREAGS